MVFGILQGGWIFYVVGTAVGVLLTWCPPICRWLLHGSRCSARGRIYALASLGFHHFAGDFWVIGTIFGIFYIYIYFILLLFNLISYENNISSYIYTYNIRIYIIYITNCLLDPVYILFIIISK